MANIVQPGIDLYKGFFFFLLGGGVAKWLAHRTRNPAVPGASPALATL